MHRCCMYWGICWVIVEYDSKKFCQGVLLTIYVFPEQATRFRGARSSIIPLAKEGTSREGAIGPKEVDLCQQEGIQAVQSECY
jgi:hypothetical protein